MHQNLHSFIEKLDKTNNLCRVDAQVDPYLELAEIHRRVIAADGPALLFSNVKGKKFPVITNLFGTKERVGFAFGDDPVKFIQSVASLPEELLPPTLSKIWEKRSFFFKASKIGFKSSFRAPVLKHSIPEADLNQLPAITSWPEDGGPFITLPLVHTKGPGPKPDNLGMYRIQIFEAGETGMHFQIGKGGGFHYFEAEKAGQHLPANIYLGGPPALMLSAIAPLPENVPELLLSSLLLGKKMKRSRVPGHPLDPISEAEFAILGEIPPQVRRPEGPFGDHYGYYSLQHEYPVFRPKHIFHRKGAIFPATVVGKPRQEDFYLGDFLQELLAPLFPLVMPAVKDLWSYGETGYHALSAACLSERYNRESMSSVFRILGEGQLSLTKFLIGLDKKIDLKDFKGVLSHVLSRADWRKDLFVFSELSMDSLDYTGPVVNKGSKGVILGMGEPIRKLPKNFTRSVENSLVKNIRVYAPGCLVIEVPAYKQNREAVQDLAKLSQFADWPLIIAVDDVDKACRSDSSFLWTTFTRFEPAADIYAYDYEIRRHHISYKGPIVIDARMKPWYPKELFCDSQTRQLVDERWKQYFPDKKINMGSSDWAHL
ncbi:MAG: UbiD family decarboxylase [Oligoflexales bacterium]